MGGDPEMTEIQGELPPLQSLLLAYAPARERAWHRLCWLLDQRLAAVVRRGGEPTIAAIRLAWWDEVLVADDRSKGGGEPLVEAWRRCAPEAATGQADALIDGWRGLLGPDRPLDADLEQFARQRGRGLFALIAQPGLGDAEALAAAGAAWSLWDLAGHTRDPALEASALALARPYLEGGGALSRSVPKPLRLLHAIAAADIRANRVPRGGFEGRHYRALLWRGLRP